MPVVQPFRAVRPAGADPIADRLSPPYDVISAAERARLAAAPWNPVHVILPEDDPAQGEGSRYARAARTLRSWFTEGALARDPDPAFYAYEQEFVHRGRKLVRRGFMGLLALSPFGEAGVFAHERTLTAPKEDRFRLLEATETNLSPVFALYEDPHGDVKRAFQPILEEPPDQVHGSDQQHRGFNSNRQKDERQICRAPHRRRRAFRPDARNVAPESAGARTAHRDGSASATLCVARPCAPSPICSMP